MSNPDILLQKRLAQRETWVELEPAQGSKPARRVRIRRPLETAILQLQRMEGLEAAMRCIVGWDGFTEADVLQSGGEDPVPFDEALVRDVLADRMEWVIKIDRGIADAVKARTEARAAASGNSAPTSS